MFFDKLKPEQLEKIISNGFVSKTEKLFLDKLSFYLNIEIDRQREFTLIQDKKKELTELMVY